MSIILSGCSTAQLSPEGSIARVVEEDPAGCRFIGEVTTSDFWAGNRLSAYNRALNEAAEMHADTFIVDKFTGGGGGQVHLSGRAFRCASKK